MVVFDGVYGGSWWSVAVDSDLDLILSWLVRKM